MVIDRMLTDDAWGVETRPAVVQRSDARFVRQARRIDAPTLATTEITAAGPATPPWWRLVSHASAVFVVVLAASLGVLATVPRLLGYHPVVVASGSMAPGLRTGDVVLTDPDGSVAVGTVIDFGGTGGSRIHRVVEVSAEGFRTKGDANPSVDTQLVTSDEVRGSGVMLVPFVGLPRQWLAEDRWLPLAVTAVALAVSVAFARRNFLVGAAHRPRAPA